MSEQRIALLWGIEFSGETHEKPMLLFKAWNKNGSLRAAYDGEPSEPLLFRTRRTAKAWARERRVFYCAYPIGHPCHIWRFRVVRIRRSVAKVKS